MVKKLLIGLFCLIPLLAFADDDTSIGGISASGHILQDEGTSVRQRLYLDFRGAGVGVSNVGRATRVTISGGNAADTTTVTTSFNNNLSAADDTVQKALDTLDDMAAAGTGAGTGDVVGPASSVDNAIARFSGTTGKLIQNSALTVVDDNGWIGVGITVPAYQLQVIGTGVFATLLVGNTDVRTKLEAYDAHAADSSDPHGASLTQTTGAFTTLLVGGTNVKTKLEAYDTHAADASDPHGATLTQTVINATTGTFDTLLVADTNVLTKLEAYDTHAADASNPHGVALTQTSIIGTTTATTDLIVTGALTLPANSVTNAMVSDTLTASDLVAGSSVVADAEVDNAITIASTVGLSAPTGTFTELVVSTTLTLPANSVTNAMVSDTLTASDLVAGSEVVANAEVVDDLTIASTTALSAPTGTFTTLMVGATNVGGHIVMAGTGVHGLGTLSIQNANAVAITDGVITADTGTFTELRTATYMIPAATGADNEILKWNGTALGWEADGGGSGTASMEGTVTGLMYLKAANTGAGMQFVTTNGSNLNIGTATTASAATLFIQGNTASTFPLRVANSAPADVLVITQGARVGIGTTAPTQKLDVLGNMLVTGTQAIVGTLGIANTAPVYALDVIGTINVAGTQASSFAGTVSIGTTGTKGKLHILSSSTAVSQGLYMEDGAICMKSGNSAACMTLTISGGTAAEAWVVIATP